MESEITYPLPRRTRRRTLSVSSSSSQCSRITLGPSKADSPTVALHVRSHSAYGSFIPTPSALPSLDHLQRASAYPSSSFFKRTPIYLRMPSHPWTEEEPDSPLSSAPSSPSIPSFSRTTPIDGPTGKTTSRTNVLPIKKTHVRESNELDPILASLERKSKLLTKSASCVTCKKVGSDFPKCGRCDAMWCSRQCRMVGGKRHVCSSRT